MSARRSAHGAPQALAGHEQTYSGLKRRVGTMNSACVKVSLTLAVIALYIYVQGLRLNAYTTARFGKGLEGVGQSMVSNVPDAEEVVEESSNSAGIFEKEMTRCPAGSNIMLLFPHVNKAGGRTMEATFESLTGAGKDSLRHRFISKEQRSSTHKFHLKDGHQTFPALAKMKSCYKPGSIGEECTSTSRLKCVRWVFTLRNPISRMVSAFYTMTGRPNAGGDFMKSKFRGGKGASGKSHFFCKPGSSGAQLLRDSSASIEAWTKLSDEERTNCEAAFNLHVKYLAPEEKDGSAAQLRLAKARLEAMPWFAIMEEWKTSMNLFRYAFGTDLTLYTPTFNDNHYDKTLSKEAIAVLESHNKLDIELYEFAKNLFAKRVAIMRADSKDPFSNEKDYVCDEEKICWDKSTAGDFWNFSPEENVQHFNSPGQLKENLLCTYRSGCKRERDEESGTSPSVVMKKERSSSCLVSFLILGARKGGTTSLYEYISQHPKFLGIKLDSEAQSGELLYFHKADPKNTMSAVSLQRKYDQEIMKELILGHPQFSRGELEQMITSGNYLTGESSVVNGPYCHAPEQFSRACGKKLKLVYLLRDPVERVISQYKMRHRLNTMEKSKATEAAILADLFDIEKKLSRYSLSSTGGMNTFLSALPCLYMYDYQNSIWSSMYVVHVKRWMTYYAPNSLHLIKSEEFFKNPAETLNQVIQLVGLDSSLLDVEKTVSKRYNAAPSGASTSESSSEQVADDDVSPETIARLRNFFEPFNTALHDLYDFDISGW